MSNSLPENFSYSEDHEWIDATADAAAGATVKVGITSVATERLGEVVYAELPAVGDAVTAGEPCGEVESTKSVSDIYSPVDGEVVAVNESLEDSPETVNSTPYGDGWLFRVRVSGEPTGLLSAEEYTKLTEGEE